MVSLIQLKENGDERGKLIALEGNAQVPFNINRLFYIYDTSGDSVRGKHANRNSSFAFICVAGEVKIHATDGKEKWDYALTSPSQMLVMDKMIWKEMYDFSKGAVLLVLSDCAYDKTEYIYDYSEFVLERENI